MFLFYYTAISQNNIKIQGVLVDSLTHQTLFYANVALLNQADSSLVKGVVSDEKGYFEINEVKEGDYLLRASYIGYLHQYMNLQCRSTEKTLVLDTIHLKPSTASLEGVSIIDKKPVYAFDGEKMVYNVTEDPGIQTGTLSDALQNAPGIEVDIEGNVSIRGMSSVEIWINGKPSKLTAENLKTYIQQMPANTLERIEVITNPSAKYAAEGTAGIINIVTISKILKNSFLSLGIFASTRPILCPWISYMWANEKFSINVYLNVSYAMYKSNSQGYNLLFNDNKDTSSFQKFINKNKYDYYNGYYYMNVSYAFDSMNTLSSWFSGYSGLSNYVYENDLYRKEFFPIQSTYTYNIKGKNRYNYHNIYGNVFYQHKFNNEGHNINFSAGGSLFDNTSENEYKRNYMFTDNLDKDKLKSTKSRDYSVNFQTDYSIPYIKNGEISMGILENYYQTKGLAYEDTLVPGTTNYLRDSMRIKDYVNHINAIETYLSLRHRFGNFTISAGCRFQFKQIEFLFNNSPDDNVKVNYPGLFPSLHMSYQTKSMHNFRISYTRRIVYPDPFDLSSFITYDEESYSYGNPLLQPAFTHSLDGGWSKYFQKIGDVGLSGYYKYTKNDINSLSDVVYNTFYGRIVSYSTKVNSGSGYQAGGEFHFNYRLKTFMNLRFYANIYHSQSKTVFDYAPNSLRNDTLIVTKSLSYSFRLNYWAKIFKILEINASANYRSPTKSLYLENKATYSIDCGLKADFFKRKLSVFINVSDIFNWNKQEYNRESPYYKAFNTTKYNSRYISGGIMLRFGKIEMEQRTMQGKIPE